MISIIIVNYNGKDQTCACLQSLRSVSPTLEYEVILVDNCSTDGSVELFRQRYPDVTILAQKSNEGFGRANNIGARAARGEYLFFINNDTMFLHDIVTPLREFMENHESAGVAAPMLLNPDETFQMSWGYFPSIINEMHTKINTAQMTNIPDDRSPKRVDWVSFAAVMIRRLVFEKVNGFDEHFFMYFEDSDFCYRIYKQRYYTYWLPELSLIHYKGKSYTQSDTHIFEEYRKSQLYYYGKHRMKIEKLILRIILAMKYSVRVHG